MMIRGDRPTINFLDSYRAHYKGFRETVFIRSVEPKEKEGQLIQVVLGCDGEGFSHFEFTESGTQSFQKLKDGRFSIEFESKNEWSGEFRTVFTKNAPLSYSITATRSPAIENNPESKTTVSLKITPPLEFEAKTPESWRE